MLAADPAARAGDDRDLAVEQTHGFLLLQDDEHVALFYGLPLLAEDLRDATRRRRLDGELHLHRFEDHQDVRLAHRGSDGGLDLEDRAGDVRFDVLTQTGA